MRNGSRLLVAAIGLTLILALTANAVFANAGPPAGRPASNQNNPVAHDETKSDHKSEAAKEHEAPAGNEPDGPSGGDVE